MMARIPTSLRRMPALWMAALIAIGAGAVPDVARDHDHDAARRAVEHGEIRPLAEILAAVRSQLPGDVVGVGIEQKNGRWLYEFRVIDRRGRLFEVYVDARTARIEQIKEK
jgi:uncharacterized membrane protein YkoI